MFAGVSSILLNEDNTVVLGISSREGEEILYKTPVSITEHPKINEWLTLVEKEMRVTLAKLLAESVTEVTTFNKGTSVDLNQYISWIDRYQVGIESSSDAQIQDLEEIQISCCNNRGGFLFPGPVGGSVHSDCLVREYRVCLDQCLSWWGHDTNARSALECRSQSQPVG